MLVLWLKTSNVPTKDGALIANHGAEAFLFDESSKITGVVARDLLTDQVFEIKARLVINTTGPWATRYVICRSRDPILTNASN